MRKRLRVVLAHLRVGVAERRPVAVARDVHAEHVEAGIAVDHPVRQREADAAALAEPGHDAAGDPEVLEALDRADQRVAVRREREGAVDDLADAGPLEGREMAEADLELGRDALEIGLEEVLPEIPRRLLLRPRAARLLVGAEQDAAAFLAHVDLALEVERGDHLLAGRTIELGDLRHVLGEEVHVLHGEHRQLQPDHAPDLARPQPAAVDDVLGVHRAPVGDDVPGSVGTLDEVGHAGAQDDLGALHPRRFRISMGRAVGVEMTLEGFPHSAGELALVQQAGGAPWPRRPR